MKFPWMEIRCFYFIGSNKIELALYVYLDCESSMFFKDTSSYHHSKSSTSAFERFQLHRSFWTVYTQLFNCFEM